MGRFTSQDSYLGQTDDPPSLHRYFYANANPVRYIDLTGHGNDDLAEAARRNGKINTRIAGMDQGGRRLRGQDPRAPVSRPRVDNGGYERPPGLDEQIHRQAMENEAQRQWWESQRAKVILEGESAVQKALRAEAEFEEKAKTGAANISRTFTEDATKPAEHGFMENRRVAAQDAQLDGDPRRLGAPAIAGDFQQNAGDITAVGAYGLTTLAIEGGKILILDGAQRVVGEVADAAAAKAFIREAEASGEIRVLAKEGEAGGEARAFAKEAEAGATSRQGLAKPPTGRGSVPPAERDPKRVWSKGEKQEALSARGGKCERCDEPISIDEAKGHHKQRHADGGKTDDDNLSILCPDCHKEIHKP